MSDDVMARVANPTKPKKSGRKKARSAKQKANDKRLGAMARARHAAKKRSGARKAPARTEEGRPMAKRKKARKGGGKKRRSAAQKAATAKLVAMNKGKGRRKSGGGKKRKSAKRTSTKRTSPRKRAKRSTAVTVRMSNPTSSRRKARKGRKSGRSRHRNPGMPLWARVACGAVVGAAIPAVAKAVARRVAPLHAETIGHVFTGVAILGAASMMRKYPIAAPALAAGAVASDVAPTLSARVERMLASTPEQAAVAEARIQGTRFIAALGAVTADDMGAVTADDMGFLPESPYGMGGRQYLY